MLDVFQTRSDAVLLIAVVAVGVVAGQYVSSAARRFVPAGPALAAESRSRQAQWWASPAVAALFGLLAWRLGSSWALPAYLFFAAAGMLLALVDVRYQLLPNKMLARTLGIGVLLLTVAAALDDDWGGLGRAAVGALLLFSVYLVLALLSPTSMGMGDVKFAAVIGLFLAFSGWEALLLGSLAGFAAGGIVSAWLLLSRHGGPSSKVAFGPSMLLGALIVLLA